MPRHFFKTMMSPYFQSEHYRNSPAGQIEQKVEKIVNFLPKKIKKRFGKKTK